MKNAVVLLYHYFAGISRNLSPLHTDHACKVQCVIPLRQKDKKKSEPISDLENLVRIYMRLVHPAGVEPVAFRVGVARMGF